MENRKDERRGLSFCSSFRVEYGCRRGIVSGPPRARRRPCARWLGAAAPAHLSQARRFSSSSKPGGCGTSASIASDPRPPQAASRSLPRAASLLRRASLRAALSALLRAALRGPTARRASLRSPFRGRTLLRSGCFLRASRRALRALAGDALRRALLRRALRTLGRALLRAALRGGGCALSPFAALRTQPLDLLVGRLFDPPDALGHVLRRVRLGGPAQKALALLAFGPRVLVLFHLALAPVELELVQRAAADLVLILNFRPVLRHLPSSNCGPLDTARRRFVYFSTLSHLSSVGRATVS